jgi:hypothetical protein
VSEERRARGFLLGIGAVFIPFFAVPLFVDPYWWAERFGWDAGPETDLGVYFGRCLGAVAFGVAVTALMASRAPARSRALFDVVAIGGALLALAHLRGLIEDSQPLVEHIETGLYAGVAALSLWCTPPEPG